MHFAKQICRSALKRLRFPEIAVCKKNTDITEHMVLVWKYGSYSRTEHQADAKPGWRTPIHHVPIWAVYSAAVFSEEISSGFESFSLKSHPAL